MNPGPHGLGHSGNRWRFRLVTACAFSSFFFAGVLAVCETIKAALGGHTKYPRGLHLDPWATINGYGMLQRIRSADAAGQEPVEFTGSPAVPHRSH
jgi:hypothetical protein